MKNMILIKLAFILIFFSFGTLGCYQVYKGLSEMSAARSWHSVTGMIKDIELVKKTGTQKRPTTTTHIVHYRYSVNRQHYQGSRAYFGVTMARHNERAASYKAGNPIDVYYNPANPTQSVLHPTSYRGIIIPTLISILFLITSIYLVWTLKR